MTDVKTWLFLLSEFIWIKSEDEVVANSNRPPGSLKRNTKRVESWFGKLLLTFVLLSFLFDPPSAPFEMQRMSVSLRNIITTVTAQTKTNYKKKSSKSTKPQALLDLSPSDASEVQTKRRLGSSLCENPGGITRRNPYTYKAFSA